MSLVPAKVSARQEFNSRRSRQGGLSPGHVAHNKALARRYRCLVILRKYESYCQKLCMGLSCGGAILAFSVDEFDAANDLGELI